MIAGKIDTMTVSELIEKLQQFPPDTQVVIHDGEYEDSWCVVDVFQKQLWGHEVVKITPFADERHWETNKGPAE